MKKIHIYVTVASVMIFASCGGNKKDTNAYESDSASTSEMLSDIAGPVDYFLTQDSIGPIRVGETISSLPAAVPNLYDVMLTTDTPDAMAYTFLLADIPQFTIYDFMEGKVDVIALEGNARAIQIPDGELRVGDEFTKVLSLPGIQSEWEGFDDGGVWYWKWNGLYIGVDETNIPEKLGEALCDGKRPPRAAAFTSDIKVGYIGTGLPF